MRHVPEHRFIAVTESPDSDFDDPLMASLAEIVSGGGTSLEDVMYAYELNEQPEHKATLDAFLLSDTPITTVSDLLRIPEKVLETYQHLFMDTSVFRNRLEVGTYAANYRGSDYARELVRAAVTVGPEYLLWTYGATKELDTKYVIRRTMTEAFYRGMAHKGNSITSNTAKEALKWWTTAVKNADQLEKIDPSTSKSLQNELEIALFARDETSAADESPIPLDEILH